MAPLERPQNGGAQVISLPLPADPFTADDLARHTAASAGKLLAENADLMIENECLRSSWLAVMRRIEAMQLRRLQLLRIGAAAGFVVALVVDGTIARWFS